MKKYIGIYQRLRTQSVKGEGALVAAAGEVHKTFSTKLRKRSRGRPARIINQLTNDTDIRK